LSAPARDWRRASGRPRRCSTRDRKLIGPLAYYAFDNAVVWAAFRAFGHNPPVGIIVVAYVIG
jgi:hypothetical protein